MFTPPPSVTARVWVRIPEAELVEGPAFDRAGHLWMTDIPTGRIFRITADGAVTTVARYDGEPNGLAIHRDGRVFIADHQQGLLALDPTTGKISTVLDRPYGERFRGLNDVTFASNGDCYFTDQGESDQRDPSGRLYRLRGDGGLDCLLDRVPSPNGLVLTPDEKTLYLAVTRANAVWRVPLFGQTPGFRGPSRLGLGRVGIWLQLSGGTGPDGMAMAADGSIVVAHVGLGSLWVFDRFGEPIRRVRCAEGFRCTNVAFGGPRGTTVYITEADSGAVQTAELDLPGHPLFSHA